MTDIHVRLGGAEGGVSDHTLLTNIGTNSHATVDTHLANTSNPHTVTKSQVLTGDLIVNADVDASAAIVASKIEMANIGSPSYTTAQHMQDTFHSSGLISGGAVTDGGSNTVNVALGEGYLRATDSSVAELLFIDWSAATGLSVPSGTTRFVGIEYNAGSPQAVVRTSDDFDRNTDFCLAVVTNEGGTVYVADAPHKVADHANGMIERIHQVSGIQRDNVLGGLILGETGTRNITVSAGALWDRLNRSTVSALDTSATDTFNRYYDDGGSGHTLEADQTQWNNTQYDDGDGGLATLGANKYAVQWFYLTLGGALLCMYGTAEHNSEAQAEDEQPPSDVPDRVGDMSGLIGRLIFKNGDATATEIETVFDTTFGGAIVTDHNNLSNIGTNDHTAIDSHIAATAAHGVGEVVGTSENQTLTNKTIDGDNNTVINVTYSLGVHQHVRKGSAGTITKGTPVYVTGHNIGGNYYEVEESVAETLSTLPALGLARESITNSSDAHLVEIGALEDFDTTAWNEGDLLYVAIGGGLTNIKPTGANYIQSIAVVARDHVTNGVLFVDGPGRVAALPNLPNGKFWKGDGDGVPQEVSIVEADVTDAGTTFVLDSDIGGSVQAYDATNVLDADVTYELLDTNGDVGTIAGTLAIGDHNHSSIYQPLDTDLTNIAALTGSSGFLKTDGATVWTVDTDTYLTDIAGDSTPQLGGDLDVDGNDIVSTSNGAIKLLPDGTGRSIITNIEAALQINVQTGTTYTGVIDDAEKVITLNNAAAITMTIPANSSVAYPVGTKLNFMQLGAGQVTVAITTDTLNVESGLTLLLTGQYAVATAFKTTSTTWVLFGNLESA